MFSLHHYLEMYSTIQDIAKHFNFLHGGVNGNWIDGLVTLPKHSAQSQIAWNPLGAILLKSCIQTFFFVGFYFFEVGRIHSHIFRGAAQKRGSVNIASDQV